MKNFKVFNLFGFPIYIWINLSYWTLSIGIDRRFIAISILCFYLTISLVKIKCVKINWIQDNTVNK